MHTSATLSPAGLNSVETHTLHVIQATLKFTFGLVAIVAGLDKFTHLLVDWTQYLNPALLRLLPFDPHVFMYFVGLIEMAAGILVLFRPRIGAWIVSAWLALIALQLLAGWMYVDVAVRDLVMAVAAMTLARLSMVVDAPPHA